MAVHFAVEAEDQDDTPLGATAPLCQQPAAGEQGVAHLLDLIASEMKVAMTLTGARAVGEISRESLVRA